MYRDSMQTWISLVMGVNLLDIDRLKTWFLTQKRDLPWRQIEDPYAIWVSEIMLQQTQVAVVIPYFLNWISYFPTIHHLAEASLDEVLKAWEGLGYYSRARNLHEAAKYVVKYFYGQLPDKEEELKKIKGLGPYTIGAILSFAFHQKKAAVDGNVMRVLTRYFGIEEDISKVSTVNRLRQLAQNLLPEEEPWIINEALIELGATLCQRKAQCEKCPLSESCLSRQQGTVDLIPLNSKKIKIEHLFRAVAVIQWDSHFLVTRGERGAIMSDLYEFPYFEVDKETLDLQDLEAKIRENYDFSLIQRCVLKEVKHGFTRYQARLYPIWFNCQQPKKIENFEWLSYQELKQLAFSSGHRRVFQQLGDLLLQA